MKPLEEDAHLFANGEFKIRIYPKDKNINHIDEPFNGTWLRFAQETGSKNCTLIARPIEDMTDQELIDVRGAMASSLEPDEREILVDQFKRMVNDWENMDTKTFINLIDRGVLPFPQTLFEDETVIDSRTL